MKLRLKSYSVRYRLTAADMEQLRQEGRVECTTVMPLAGGEQRRFTFAVELGGTGDSGMRANNGGFTLVLADEDWRTLNSDENEGVYLRREWMDDSGQAQRTVFYVEKDQKADKHKHKAKKRNDTVTLEGGGSEL